MFYYVLNVGISSGITRFKQMRLPHDPLSNVLHLHMCFLLLFRVERAFDELYLVTVFGNMMALVNIAHQILSTVAPSLLVKGPPYLAIWKIFYVMLRLFRICTGYEH